MSGGRIRTAQRAVIAVVLLITAGFVAIMSSGAANADDPDTCGVPGNLVQNCGFESGAFLPGWTHSNPDGANAEGQVNGFNPHTGASAYRDGSVGSSDFLSQDLTVVPGDSYRLNFFAVNEEQQGVNSFVATVHTGGTSPTTTQVFADNGSTIGTAYGSFGGVFTVPADASTTATLTFAIRHDPSYYDLDDVSVAQSSADVSLSAAPEGGSTAGDSVTITATVSGNGPDPTGTVEFDSNSSPISLCSSQPLSTTSGTTTATCTTSDLATGSDSLTATYAGDGNYASSQSSPLVYPVSPEPTPSPTPDTPTVTLHASPPGGSTDGDAVTLTAGVTGPGDAPTGSVQFDSNGSPIPGCASKALSTSAGSATATCQTSDLAVGDDNLLVIYSGDSNYTGGSDQMGYQVTPAPTPSPSPTPTPTDTPSPAPTPSSSSSVPCPPDNPCTVTVAAKGSNATATIHAKSGPHRTKVKASFGTAAGKIHPCGAKKKAILTFSGDRKKTVILRFHSSHPRHRFCYGQPKPFITASGDLTKRFNQKNHEYEGILPRCRVTHTRPCVKRRHFHHKIQTVVVKSGVIDPHISH